MPPWSCPHPFSCEFSVDARGQRRLRRDPVPAKWENLSSLSFFLRYLVMEEPVLFIEVLEGDQFRVNPLALEALAKYECNVKVTIHTRQGSLQRPLLPPPLASGRTGGLGGWHIPVGQELIDELASRS